MGASSTKEVNLTKSIEDKEQKALDKCFAELTNYWGTHNDKTPILTDHKCFSIIFGDYENFHKKLYEWMIYCKENLGKSITLWIK